MYHFSICGLFAEGVGRVAILIGRWGYKDRNPPLHPFHGILTYTTHSVYNNSGFPSPHPINVT
jgi:hypothetical protein